MKPEYRQQIDAKWKKKVEQVVRWVMIMVQEQVGLMMRHETW